MRRFFAPRSCKSTSNNCQPTMPQAHKNPHIPQEIRECGAGGGCSKTHKHHTSVRVSEAAQKNPKQKTIATNIATSAHTITHTPHEFRDGAGAAEDPVNTNIATITQRPSKKSGEVVELQMIRINRNTCNKSNQRHTNQPTHLKTKMLLSA